MFSIPGAEDDGSPWPIYERLRRDAPEFEEIRDFEPTVAFLFRHESKVKNGKLILGMCSMPGVQGDLSPLFDWLLERVLGYAPIYLIWFDSQWWETATPLQREALTFHELSHIAIKKDQYGVQRFNQQTGDPVWGIIGHSLEEFDAVVRRYGAWTCDIERFVAAAREGGAA